MPAVPNISRSTVLHVKLRKLEFGLVVCACDGFSAEFEIGYRYGTVFDESYAVVAGGNVGVRF